jgi:hypothetical protein
MEVRFAGAHKFLDASLHFADLRGRNMLLNAARWLVAFTAAEARVVYVNVDAEGVDRDLLREVAYLVYPARVEVGDTAVAGLGCAEGGGVCSLCGRGGVVTWGDDWFAHVTQGEALDAPCLAARLFGRAANKPAFLFALLRRKSLPKEPSLVLPMGVLTLYFWRHGGGGGCPDDSAALCLHDRCVAVLGVRGNCVEAGPYLAGMRRAERFEEAVAVREEFLRRIAGEVVPGLEPVYQPRGGSVGEGFVPHLSGVNAGGREVDTEVLASLAGTNTVFLVRVDGDRFGERTKQLREEVVAQFKSAVAGVFEAGPSSGAGRARYHAAVIYAGGDENMFVASARGVDAVLKTLMRAREFFRQALGGTISAGVVGLRYKLPMYHAVYHANRAAEAAKEAGRDAVALIYLKSILAEEMGIVKFDVLEEALRLARRYADERPPLEAGCLQQALPHLLGHVPAATGLDRTVAFILNTAPLLEL